VFGGSFNPVHWGHLLLAEEVREEFDCDLAIFVPAARSPFKEGTDDPGAGHRLAMLRLACAGNAGFRVDDRELRRGGVSYTIDTLREIVRDYGSTEPPRLLVGDDLVPGMPRWRDSEALEREAKVIVARRSQVEESVPDRYVRARNRLIPIASSEIRMLLASGRSVRYLLPESVFEYIASQGLYAPR
jgi:nicotinate-nucleotide adenylyltransferase